MRGFLCFLFFISACTPLPTVNAGKEYTDAVRRLDLNPVYPPRQSLRVGDVLYQRKESDGEIVLEFAGHLNTFEEFAADYDHDAYPIHLNRQRTDSAGKPLPFSDRASVMPIAFPSISVSAASAVGLGSALSGGREFLSFGRARTVTIGFENTRQFGLPDKVLPPENVYRGELLKLRSHPKLACETTTLVNGDSTVSPKTMVAIVTRIIITNLITFTSSSARGARAGAATQSAPVVTGAATAPVNLTISIPGNASAAQVQEIMAAAASYSSPQNPHAIGVATSSGSSVTYSKPLDGYVAIAYYPKKIDFCEVLKSGNVK